MEDDAGFRPTEEELRIIEANQRQGETAGDVIRRALRLLDREAEVECARAARHRPMSEAPAETGADLLFCLVGDRGFEPLTPSASRKCSTPELIARAPGANRTAKSSRRRQLPLMSGSN